MLSTIYSFYAQNFSPTLSMLWDRIPNLPTDKIPSAKKVALCALGLFCLHKIYRSYQSLLERVTLVESTLQKATAANGALEKKLATAVETSRTLETRLKRVEENTFYSANNTEDEEVSEKDVLDNQASPLETFKQQFPGQTLACTVEGEQTTFSAFILQYLIGIDDVSDCKDLGDGKYLLTYTTEKKALFSKLPDNVPPPIKTLVEPMLNTPVTFANPMTIQIFEDNSKWGFVFLDEAILATKTIGYSYLSATYKGYLETVHVYKKPIGKDTIYVQGNHNSTAFAAYKSGDLPHQKFVDMLYANLKA